MRVNNEQQNLNAVNDARKALASYENELSILDDLFLTAETETEIKAGCIGCGWGPPVTNHNETTVSDKEDEAQLDDLGLTDDELDRIKGGRGGSEDGGGGGMGGDWVINHNETTVNDEEDEIRLADLRLTDEELDGIKGGPDGTQRDSGLWLNNHNETILTDTLN